MRKLGRTGAAVVVAAASIISIAGGTSAVAEPLTQAALTPPFQPNFIHDPSCKWVSSGGHSAVIDLQPQLSSTIRVMERTPAGNLIGPVEAKRQTSPNKFDAPKLLQVTLQKGEAARFEMTWTPNYDEHDGDRTRNNLKFLVVQQQSGSTWTTTFEKSVTLPSVRQCMWVSAGK